VSQQKRARIGGAVAATARQDRSHFPRDRDIGRAASVAIVMMQEFEPRRMPAQAGVARVRLYDGAPETFHDGDGRRRAAETK
jgi:hypothetical protein